MDLSDDFFSLSFTYKGSSTKKVLPKIPRPGGGGRKELERDIYAKIYKWLGLTRSNQYKVLTYFG